MMKKLNILIQNDKKKIIDNGDISIHKLRYLQLIWI